MPGFLLAVNTLKQTITEAVDVLQFDSRYFCKTIFEKSNIFLAMNGYAEYPSLVFEFGDTLVLLEGKIYNKSEDSIRSFFSSIIYEDGFHTQLIEPWLTTTDGEFVVILYNRSINKILIFNDIFGRLPVYYSKKNETIIISREISFIKSMIAEVEYDRFAVASTLLFGYVPGNKTLWKSILRIPYNTIILMDLDENEIKFEVGERLTIQNTETRERISEDQLFGLLNEAVLNRINCLPDSAVSLSGGLDSRLIAGILAHSKVDISYLTYNESEDKSNADLDSVSQIVRLLKINHNHKIIDLVPETSESLETLLKTKQGLNYLGMGFIVPFLNYFKDNNLKQITGDGGDKILADLRPSITLRNECDFLNYLVTKHSIVPLEKVLKITSMHKKEYFAELMHNVNAYRAMNYEEKYALFMLHERGMVWLFEGEDRNRYFSWSTTPFYSPEFAFKALSIPMKKKKQGKLFLHLFKKMESGLETISNPNWKLAPRQQMSLRWLFIKQKLKYSLPPSVLTKIKLSELDSDQKVISEIRQEMELVRTSKPEWFHLDAVENELLVNEEFKWHFKTLLRLWN